uniref:Uncharacterized protein n=1 Tax=Oryza glaberrima TaxID=4538 RepID=I1PLY4_ORYGL
MDRVTYMAEILIYYSIFLFRFLPYQSHHRMISNYYGVGVELPTCHSAIKCWYEMCLGLALRAILILMISDAMLD